MPCSFVIWQPFIPPPRTQGVCTTTVHGIRKNAHLNLLQSERKNSMGCFPLTTDARVGAKCTAVSWESGVYIQVHRLTGLLPSPRWAGEQRCHCLEKRGRGGGRLADALHNTTPGHTTSHCQERGFLNCINKAPRLR